MSRGFQDTFSPYLLAHTFNLCFINIINIVKLEALKRRDFFFLLIGIVRTLMAQLREVRVISNALC